MHPLTSSLYTEIDLKNLAIDIVVTLVAIRYLDFTGFVDASLPYAVGALIVVQFLVFFLLWGSTTFEDLEDARGIGLARRLKLKANVWLTASVLFSGVLGLVWVMAPIEHVQNRTGEYYYWTARLVIVFGVLAGIVMLIRHFATEVEKKKIAVWRAMEESKKPMSHWIAVNLYDFLIYGNLGSERIRGWIGFIIGFAFLIYTETMFFVMARDALITPEFLIVSVYLSYFPMRMLLVLCPPFSLTELFTALVAFFVFCLYFVPLALWPK